MIQVGLARPDGAERPVFPVQLMKPGAVPAVPHLLIQIGHKPGVVLRILYPAGDLVQYSGGVDGLGQGPMHPVVNDGTAGPVGGVNQAGGAVGVPGVFDGGGGSLDRNGMLYPA